MSRESYYEKLGGLIRQQDGKKVANLLNVASTQAIDYFKGNSNYQNDAARYLPKEWKEIGVFFGTCLKSMLKSDYDGFFRAYEKVITSLNRTATNEGIWIIPVLKKSAVTITKMTAVCSDNSTKLKEYLELASRCINGTFKICLNDRQSDNITTTKKIAAYFFAGMMLRVYFRLKAYSLAKGITKAINAVGHTIPPLESSPIADQVVYNYYSGVLDFMSQSYSTAETKLSKCISLIPLSAKKSRETVLLYLIPANQLVNTKLPSQELWDEFPELETLYKPFFDALKLGQLGLYAQLLTEHQNFLVNRHLYFAFTKLSQACSLHLIFRTWLALGKGNRLKVDDLAAAYNLEGFFGDIFNTAEEQANAVELQVAEMISTARMRGYISHSMRTVVLSNRNPFPTLVKPESA